MSHLRRYKHTFTNDSVTCSNDLTKRPNDLITCSTDSGKCPKDLDKYSNDLDNRINDLDNYPNELDKWSNDLTKCPNDLVTYTNGLYKRINDLETYFTDPNQFIIDNYKLRYLVEKSYTESHGKTTRWNTELILISINSQCHSVSVLDFSIIFAY